ncbi:MAG: O-antigen ligase family protein [Candidatus Omnitrophica bacterium]|nr:O-antigen ligase family protein [Candidatus Omnitrophota bacterium]
MNPSVRLRAVRILHQSLLSIILALSLFGLDPASMTSVWMKAAMIAALGTLCALCAFERLKPEDMPRSALLTLGVTALTACVICFQSGAAHNFGARQYLYHLLFYMAFFMALLPIARRPEAFQRLLTYASMLGLLAALFGIAYRFTGSWDLLGRDRSQLSSASFGFFYYENTFGAFAALLMPLTASVLYYRYVRYAAGGDTLLKRVARFVKGSLDSGVLFLLASLLVMGIGLVATNSRASLLILLVFYSAVACVLLPGKHKLAIIALAVVSIAGFALLTSAKLLETTVNGLAWERLVHDAQTRLEIIQMNARLFLERPWTGWGMGQYKYVSMRHLISGGPDSINTVYRFEHAHGSYADLLIEGGIFVAILLTAAVLIIPAAARPYNDGSLYRRLIRWQGLLAMASFAPMLLSDSHLRAPAVVLLLLIQLAAVASSTRAYHYEDDLRTQDRRDRSGRRFRTGVYAAAVLCALLLTADGVRSYHVSVLTNSWIPTDQKLSRLETIRPDDPDPYVRTHFLNYNRALKAGSGEGRQDFALKAAAAIDPAIELVPSNPYFYYCKARALRAAGEPERAMEELERAVALSPVNIKFKTDLMMLSLFEARETVSVLKRNRWNLRARQLYEDLRSSPYYPETGFTKIRRFVDAPITKEQKQYLWDFLEIADRNRAELQRTESE